MLFDHAPERWNPAELRAAFDGDGDGRRRIVLPPDGRSRRGGTVLDARVVPSFENPAARLLLLTASEGPQPG
jgi:hypothetical protein